MPNKASARKRMRQASKARVRNRAQRSALRTAIKNVRRITDAPHPEAAALKTIDAGVVEAQKRIGKAAKVGLIKKNTASRLQSRMMKALNKARTKASGA